MKACESNKAPTTSSMLLKVLFDLQQLEPL